MKHLLCLVSFIPGYSVQSIAGFTWSNIRPDSGIKSPGRHTVWPACQHAEAITRSLQWSAGGYVSSNTYKQVSEFSMTKCITLHEVQISKAQFPWNFFF